MRPPLLPARGVGLLIGTAAVAGILALTLSGRGNAEAPATPKAEPPKSSQSPVAPQPAPEMQNVSPPAEESEFRIGNLSVIELMEGALAARERNDLAYLARCMESSIGKETLLEDDLLAAHRQFKWRSADGVWNHVRRSWNERSYEVVEDGDSAEMVMQVGGNLGEMRLRFVRNGNSWFFAGM
jgi:hypothetical protein